MSLIVASLALSSETQIVNHPDISIKHVKNIVGQTGENQRRKNDIESSTDESYLENTEQSTQKQRKREETTYEQRIKHREPLPSQYKLEPNLFVTPKTHPGLFSFSGRWLSHRDTYLASAWPGTSVKILVYGPECTIKLRALASRGTINNHRFYVSVDTPDQFVLSIPSYNATENFVFDVKLELNAINPSLNISSQPQETQLKIPHVLEVMSEESSPLEFLGVSLINHKLIHPNQKWLFQQNSIPHFEFISDTLSQSPSLHHSNLYRAARKLGIRSSFVQIVNNCFSNACFASSAGLADQYALFSPFKGDPSPRDVRENMPIFYNFNPIEPLFPTTLPQFIVVDVGYNDLQHHHNVSGAEFMKSLQMLLGNIVVNYNPTAQIRVFVRDDRYVTETENAVISMNNNRIRAIKFGQDTVEWYKSFLCSYISEFPISSSSSPISTNYNSDNHDDNNPVTSNCKPYLSTFPHIDIHRYDQLSRASFIWAVLCVTSFTFFLYKCLKYCHSVNWLFRSKNRSYSHVSEYEELENSAYWK